MLQQFVIFNQANQKCLSYCWTVGRKYLFKVSKITLKQRPDGRYFTDFEQVFSHPVDLQQGLK